MAERLKGLNNEDLVNKLKANKVFTSDRVSKTMKSVNRGYFCNTHQYLDAPQGIGCNATISAPHMHAKTLEILNDYLLDGCTALDVGSGSGYLTTCMATMVGSKGRVIGIDHIPQLVTQATANVKKQYPDYITSGRLRFVVGDGRIGFAEGGPYDVIHIGGAIPQIPQGLLDQLKPGGRLLVPVGPQEDAQLLQQVDKLSNGTFRPTNLLSVRYGSLTDRKKQCPELGNITAAETAHLDSALAGMNLGSDVESQVKRIIGGVGAGGGGGGGGGGGRGGDVTYNVTVNINK